MTDITLRERLVAVETKLESLADDAHKREEVQQEMLDKLTELHEEFHEMQSTLMKYKGFIGGVVFLASALGTFFFKFFNPIWTMFAGKPSG